MGASDQKLNVQLTLDASGMIQGLTVASKGVETTAQSIKQNFKAASDGGDGLSSSLRDFKKEATQASRVANFYARDLAEIVPGASGATGAIKGLIAAGLSGGGLFAAFEVGLVTIKAVWDALKEQELEVKKLRDVHMDTALEITKGLTGVQRALDGTTTKVQAFKQSFADATTAELVKSNKEAADLLQKSGGIVDFIRYMGSVIAHGPEHATTGIDDDLNKTFSGVLQRIRDFDGNKKKMAAEEAKENEKLTAESDARILQIHAQTADAVTKQEADTRAKIAEIRLKANPNDMAAQSRAEDQIKAIQADSAIKVARIREDKLQEVRALERTLTLENATEAEKILGEAQNKIEKARLEASRTTDAALRADILNLANFELETAKKKAARLNAQDQAKIDAEDIAETRRHYKEKEAVTDEWVRQELAAMKKLGEEEARSMANGAKQFGDAFGQAFSGIVSGTQSAAKALSNMGGAAVKAFLEMQIHAVEASMVAKAAQASTAVSGVTGNAAVAASGAAASQASIPFIGPGLAIAAMAAMEAAVLGLLSLIPSASGGWTVPTSIGPAGMIANVHAGEKILPRKQTEGLDALIAGGGGGGIHIHHHFEAGTVVDQATLDRHVASSAYQNSVRKAVRQGRWAAP